jgi:hypothetical protein
LSESCDRSWEPVVALAVYAQAMRMSDEERTRLRALVEGAPEDARVNAESTQRTKVAANAGLTGVNERTD